MPDYLCDFIGQFLADPRRVNQQMAAEFLSEFYVLAAEAFPAARAYAESQLRQIALWRDALPD